MRELNSVEIRVLGALIEKQVTTPDHYPLSLNALCNACNQKSNREPVLNLEESEVQDALDSLIAINQVSEVRLGGRVAKYKHRFCNTEFSNLHLAPPELAVICLLLLRGPQTPGELRSRADRLHPFSAVQEVEASLEDLTKADASPMVAKLPRQPGRRESRYMHLLAGELDLDHPDFESDSADGNTKGSNQNERIEKLEEQVVSMQAEIELLKMQWDDLNN